MIRTNYATSREPACYWELSKYQRIRVDVYSQIEAVSQSQDCTRNPGAVTQQNHTRLVLWFKQREGIQLTHDEEGGADQHSPREHMFGAGLLAAGPHGPQLVRQWVGPEVGQK